MADTTREAVDTLPSADVPDVDLPHSHSRSTGSVFF
jgi:hypothetical protein